MRCASAALIAATILLSAAGAAHAATATPTPAPTAPCRTGGPFERWLDQFKREALSQGISQSAIAAASPYLTYDARIVGIDRGQRIFTQTFVEFSSRMVPAGRVSMGQAQLKKHAAVLAKAEQQYGVPGEVIAAFWGLESDYGANMGKDNSIRAITSLAYDCRRADMFREHLFSALKLIDRGDLRPEEMIGSWAGELGQTQMMPTEYMKYAVDYDGDGHRNLLTSAADVIGSTANYITTLGWKRGEPWLQEIRVPQNLPWEQAGLDVQHPRSQWVRLGVTLANGQPLPNDALKGSVLLPMGRFGPAFMVYDNFKAYLTWNNSLVYSTTAAYFATRLAGAAAMQKGGNVPPALSFEDTKALQQALATRGYDVGRIDGILGLKSRPAIRDVQMKLGLPADSYPTHDLVSRLRAGR